MRPDPADPKLAPSGDRDAPTLPRGFDVGLDAGPVACDEMPVATDCGAESIFLGRIRAEDDPELGALEAIEYGAYESMAIARLREIVAAIAVTHGVRRARVRHSLGRVGIGEASIVVQVATGHRVRSFEACRAVVDAVKDSVPIWKREVFERGERWQDG